MSNISLQFLLLGLFPTGSMIEASMSFSSDFLRKKLSP